MKTFMQIASVVVAGSLLIWLLSGLVSTILEHYVLTIVILGLFLLILFGVAVVVKSRGK